MRRVIQAIVAVSCVVLAIGLFTGCACCKGQKNHMVRKMAMTQVAYVCPDCHMLALKAGKCPMCQKDMSAMHVLGVKDGNAMLCGCSAACKCDSAGIKDGKCACGKEIKTMSVKGMYVCPEGCPVISDKPGKCMCNKDLVKVQ